MTIQLGSGNYTTTMQMNSFTATLQASGDYQLDVIWNVIDELKTSDRTASKRFTEHPETIEGDVSPAFVEMVMCIHPSQGYSSAEVALMCRQAYDMGRKEK